MLWYLYEDYFGMTNLDLYTKANYYDRVQPFLFNMQRLLNNMQGEMQEFTDKAFEDLRKEKKKCQIYMN